MLNENQFLAAAGKRAAKRSAKNIFMFSGRDASPMPGCGKN